MCLGLVIGQACVKAFLPIAWMAMCVLEFFGDSDSQDHKKYCECISINWYAQKSFGFSKCVNTSAYFT